MKIFVLIVYNCIILPSKDYIFFSRSNKDVNRKSEGCKRNFKGKIILLTGAGGGIGLEAAKTFAYMGAKIIIAEIDSFKGKQAQDSINAMFKGFPVEFYEIDLSKDKQIYKMYNYIMKKHGCVDILFNNATTIAMGNVEDVPIETWIKVI